MGKKVKRVLKKRPRTKEPGRLSRWWNDLAEESRHSIGMGLLWVAIALTIAGGAAFGLKRLEAYVFSHPQFNQNHAQVQLANKPEWMSSSLEKELLSEFTEGAGDRPPTFDVTLARQIHDSAARCPWVKTLHEVRVERTPSRDGRFSSGVVLVRADYRQPVALAVSGDREEYIDETGVILPREQVPTDRFYPRISGIAARPPEAGKRWESPDLLAGLLMVSRLRQEPYYREISLIDVGNYENRRNLSEPAIVLKAEANGATTDIKFGRMPLDNLPVGEPTTERKLGYLSSFYHKNGSLVGLKWLELRRDMLYVSEN